MSFAVSAGELVCAGLQDDGEGMPLLELATGLLPPTRGCVRCHGQDWDCMGYWEQMHTRGTIGSLPEQHSWLSAQTVLQNVLLRLRHHTTRREADLAAEADRLARQIGLPGLSRKRPNQVPLRELRMAGYVRAFCGRPDLVLLMCPEFGAPRNWPDALQALLQGALGTGSAVFLVSRDEAVWRMPVVEQARQYQIVNGVWAQRK